MTFVLIIIGLTYLAAPIVMIVMANRTNRQMQRLDRVLLALDARLESLGANALAQPRETADVASLDPAIAAAPAQPTELQAADPLAPPPEADLPVVTGSATPYSLPDQEGAEVAQASLQAAVEIVPASAPAGAPEYAPEQAAGRAPPDAPAAPPAAPPRPRDFSDLEKRFGTQWVVWVGGIALALGGIFLVRYSIEQGLFGPGLRIIMGAVLALALVGLGELARRREIVSGLANVPTAHIPSILTAAGTTVAYADVYAAHALYQFLPAGLAFVLLGAVALATLAAALVHGPALGGLGLIGAFATPALVSTAQPNYWALYVYLAVVTAAAYALTRARGWRWLAITAAAFSVLWMSAGIGDPRAESLWAHAFHAVAGFGLAAAFVVPGPPYAPQPQRGRIDPLSSGVLAGYLFGALMLVFATRHDGVALTVFALLAAGTVAIAWRAEAAMAALPIAAAFAAVIVVHWSANLDLETLLRHHRAAAVSPVQSLGPHLAFGTAMAALFGAAGYLAQGRSREPMSVVWAATAVATPVIILVALYWRLVDFGSPASFAALAFLLAALFGLATKKLIDRDQRPSLDAAAIFAAGTVASLALALTFALEKGWLTVALALTVPGIAATADRRPLPFLRILCAAMAALVMVRVAWDPRVVGDDVGTTPIFNWLLWGYGVPAVSFWIAGRLLRRQADDTPTRMVESAAITFTALTAFLEIRHLMNDGDIYKPTVGLGEIGLQISTGLAMVIGFEHVRVRSGSVIHDAASRLVGMLTVAAIVLGLGIQQNPMLTGDPVGGAFFNAVLLGYGIPALLMAVLARTIRRTRPPRIYLGAAILAIVLMLAYLTLEVRTAFQGPVLNSGAVSDAEDYTYSAVWLVFGVVLLLAGIVLQSQPARLASAAVVVLTIAKVFLHDLAGVQGIYRALSFIGLGLVLIGIGWLYQRLLFPRRPSAGAPDAPPAPAE